MIGRGLTSWRSAANAPDEYQNASTIVGAFGSCNGVLDRPPVWSANGHGNPGASLLPPRSRALRRRVALISRNHSRSRCPTCARRGPAQARGDQPDDSIAISLPGHACTPGASARAHRAAAWQTRAATPHSPRAPLNTSLLMLGRGLTSWRSAANAPDDDQNAFTIVGAFVSCNGGLDARRRPRVGMRLQQLAQALELVAGKRKSNPFSAISLLSVQR